MLSKIDTIKEAYAALNRNDMTAFLSIFDEKIERIEPSDFPEGGIYHGIDVVAPYFISARNTWAEGSCEPAKITVFGDHIVVFVHVRVRLKTETEWREGNVGDVFTFLEDKVIRFQTFVDEQQALAWVQNQA